LKQRQEISPIAVPEAICFADALPKTRSGKIIRRILGRIASGDTCNPPAAGLGDRREPLPRALARPIGSGSAIRAWPPVKGYSRAFEGPARQSGPRVALQF
jgi:hypothetical protein